MANDANVQRAYMLVNRLRAQASPNLIVTAHDAANIPSPGYLNEKSCMIPRPERVGYFDRVLADVPCSGDGTVRKAPDIFRNFDTVSGYILHPTQYNIARRGIRLLKKDGLMVYSTCSLNPIENEAVVAHLLRTHRGVIELVDTTDMVAGLKRRQGLEEWVCAMMLTDESIPESKGAAEEEEEEDGAVIEGCPANRYLKVFKDRQEYDEFMKQDNAPKKWIPRSAWPPTEEEKAWMNLKRCMRIMPQDNNTSGFFVCLLRKVAERATRSHPAPADDGDNNKDAADAPDSPDRPSNNIIPVVQRDDEFIPLPENFGQSIRNAFHFSDESLTERLFFRHGEGQKVSGKEAKRRRAEQMIKREAGELIPHNVTFTCKEIAEEIIAENTERRLHIVGLGISLFRKNQRVNDPNVDLFRVTQDGVKFVVAKAQKRVLRDFNLRDIVLLSKCGMHKSNDPLLQIIEAKYLGGPIKALSESAQKAVSTIDYRGCVILGLEEASSTRYIEYFGQPLWFSAWIGTETVTLMMNKPELTLFSDKMLRSGLIDQSMLDSVPSPDQLRRDFFPKIYFEAAQAELDQQTAAKASES
jgi:16S rRNA C967 or C1407 C5-methylase (RsmB/RsmF family)